MVIMKISDVLKTGMAKIEDEKNWIQGAFARDDKKEVVPSSDSRATCWCASGSIFAQRICVDASTQAKAVTLLNQATQSRQIAYFNDTHTHAEVIALFKRVIAEQEAKELKESEALLA
jgi:hypothetical protein